MGGRNRLDLRWQPTKAELIACIVCVVVVGFIASFAIIAYTPLRNTIPGYPNATARYYNLQNAMRIDSLERCITRWELYSENLRRVIEGSEPVRIDSIIRWSEIDRQAEAVSPSRNADSLLREIVTEEEKYELTYENIGNRRIEGLHFFKPVLGTVVHRFEIASHPYIDIAAPEGTPVKSILDGHVIYAEWNEYDQWCMVIQHENGIISIYKHNRELLKKTADMVSAGTAIAILGKEGSDEPAHLHFEMWHDGVPVNPALLIKF